MISLSRWETYLALVAVVLASVSVVDIAGRPRPVLAIVAIAILLSIGYLRLRRQLLQPKRRAAKPDAYERALRIQEDRERKYRGR